MASPAPLPCLGSRNLPVNHRRRCFGTSVSLPLPSLIAGALAKQAGGGGLQYCMHFVFPLASARFLGTNKGCPSSMWASSIGIRRKCRSKACSNSFSLSIPPSRFFSCRSLAFLRKCLFSLCLPFSCTLNFVRRCEKGQVKQLSGYTASLPRQRPDPPASSVQLRVLKR